MIVNDIDLGPDLPNLSAAPLQTNTWRQPGQTVGTALIYGSRTIVWPTGAQKPQRVETVYVEAPTALGGNAAGSPTALRALVTQLKEMADNADLNPVYIQWRSGGGVIAADPDDGWWVLENVKPDMNTEGAGWAAVEITASLVAPATPSSLSTWFSGAALSSTYTGAATPLVGFPLGSSGQAPTTLSRTGAEGALPLSLSPVPNSVPFVRPGTIAGLFQGGVRVFDTINTGSNPVPTSGGFTNANWVQVYGTQHDFVGDCIVANGLLLLLFQVGASASVYLWNTSLSTPAWQLQGTVEYQENASNTGPIQQINIDRVGLEEARVRLRAGTTAGNWAELRWKLQRGRYDAQVQFQPLVQSNTTAQGLMWRLQNAAKIAYDETSVVDLATSPGATVTPSGGLGFGGLFGQTANGPLLGWLYQNAPSSSQPGTFSSTVQGFGDTNGPAVATFRTYGIFAVPFTTAPNLQAEAESGTLGTGWSSVADAAASAGNAAKVASGTASGNADLFGTSWVPLAGQYDVWFRVKVTSAAGSAAEMTLGLWDATSSAFVTGGSTTFRANQSATSYAWLKANGTSPLTPTATHNMQFRAVTAATLGTDWFIDEAVLVPIRSTTLGVGNFPGDIWSQGMWDGSRAWVRG